MTETPARKFERKTCSRCGGSGKYSYCQMYGSTCFGCGGTGQKLTVRGKAAALYLTGLKTVKASTVRFGDRVQSLGIPGMSATTYFTVDNISTRLNSGASVDHATGDKTWYHHLALDGVTPKGERSGEYTFPDSDVRLIWTKGEARKQLVAALDYQDTLTKSGHPAEGDEQMSALYEVVALGRPKGEVFKSRGRWRWYVSPRGVETYHKRATLFDVRDHISRVVNVPSVDVKLGRIPWEKSHSESLTIGGRAAK